jgi:hypothetical protein
VANKFTVCNIFLYSAAVILSLKGNESYIFFQDAQGFTPGLGFSIIFIRVC